MYDYFMKKILIVEDDTALYTLYATELEIKNYEVSNVSDGTLAIQAMKEQKPDLVLLDLVLPGRNGLDILKEMREDSDLEEVKVIILTNFGNEDNVSTALELGAAEYIMKYKIVPSELSVKIASILGDSTDSVIKVTN